MRHLFDGGMYRMEQDGVNLASLVLHRSAVARKLARAVASGSYRLAPGTLRRIRVDGKVRTVPDYPLLGRVVHGVVAEALDDAIEPTLSPNLYSYRSGTSWTDGVAAFALFLRDHCRHRPDPRTRGLYVLRRDVDAYTDSIPVGPASQLQARGWSVSRPRCTCRPISRLSLRPELDVDRPIPEKAVTHPDQQSLEDRVLSVDEAASLL